MDVEALTRALLDPRAYALRDPATTAVELVETHISLVFLGASRVYKVKKPVDLGFLDYTDARRRLHFCREEVRLNARLAPDAYLGVVAIARAPGGEGLLVGGDGAPLEHAVEMRRLPAARMLSALLERGEIDNARMEGLAEVLARFHAAAATGPGVDEHGAPEAVAENVLDNFRALAAFAAPAGDTPPSGVCTLSPRALEHLERRARAFLDSGRDLLERRVRQGRIRDGHGDLHAGNVCFEERGITIYDCIEFSERFRCGDVACDLAFLAMDLDRRGFRAFSGWLARRYAELADDDGLEELLGFYKAYRAVVRGKVGSLRAAEANASAGQRDAAAAEARGYLDLACAYELPPALVLTCGLPASGKSVAAVALARPFEAVVLASDVRRRILHGVPPGRHHEGGVDRGLYAPQLKQRTYDDLLARAGEALDRGRTVVVDATFSERARRAPFAELARARGVPLVVVHVGAPEARVRARLAERAQDPRRVSDADLRVYLRARESFEPPTQDELGAQRLLTFASGDEPLDELPGRAIELLIAQRPAGA